MRPIRGAPSPQPRSSPSIPPYGAPPIIRRPVPGKAGGQRVITPSAEAPASGSVRYVDVRVAIPASSPFPTDTSNLLQFIHPESPSPVTISNSSMGGAMTATWTPSSSVYHGDGGSRSRQVSPYGFVPIASTGTNDMAASQQHHHHQGRSGGRFTPPFSPYSFQKSGTVSPSMMSILTEDTTTDETASLTLGSRTGMHSPTFQLHHHHHHRGSSSPSPYNNNMTPGGRASPYYAYPGSSSRPRTPTTTTGRKSPFVNNSNNSINSNNADDDSVRKSRIKTEMCMHYSNGRCCPFGANCTYAHGEEELQMTKLLDLHKAGLVDKDTYRIKPCWTWVATGSCPFGKRCTNIHDPRVGGPHDSWLPHTETQGNTMATDINVEALHQKRHHAILYGNPFGNQFSLLTDSWSDLYKLVCNINYVKQNNNNNNNSGSGNGWVDNKTSNKRQKHVAGRPLDPTVKLQIALYMRGDAEWQYKYRPQHVIHDELCMVLQKRAFCIGSSSTGSMTDGTTDGTSDSEDDLVQPIPLAKYNSRKNNHVLVRELAFGPDSDPSVRGVALWFNVREEDVSECTPQQAKRFRWKKSPVKKDHDGSPNSSHSGSHNNNNNNKSPQGNNNNKFSSNKPCFFDTADSFAMIRPDDRVAFEVVTDMMKHRLTVLQTERITNMRQRFEALRVLEAHKKQNLQVRFEHAKLDWCQWTWPINHGRTHVDKSTPVPKVDGEYSIEEEEEKTADTAKSRAENDNVPVGKHVRPIWNSFVGTDFNQHFSNDAFESFVPGTIVPSHRRLHVFATLATGIPIATDRSLPHITNPAIPMNDAMELPHSRQQERCWKALLLPSHDSHESNEWDAVREHFANSRSKKVLSIIQQKE